jgi:hypothetical protein
VLDGGAAVQRRDRSKLPPPCFFIRGDLLAAIRIPVDK